MIVQDAGRILNPLIAGGQLYGAVAQGIGGLIHEHVVYDDQGQPLATTFMDYLLPSALDVPEFEIDYIETRAPDNPLGVKGLGESGTCFSPAAISTAVGRRARGRRSTASRSAPRTSTSFSPRPASPSSRAVTR